MLSCHFSASVRPLNIAQSDIDFAILSMPLFILILVSITPPWLYHPVRGTVVQSAENFGVEQLVRSVQRSIQLWICVNNA